MNKARVCLLILMLASGPAVAQITARVQFVLTGFGPGQPFREPLAVAFEPWSSTIYVADTGNNRLLAFSAQGIPQFSTGVGAPQGVAATRERVYVSTGKTIRVFTRRGEPQPPVDLSQAAPQPVLSPARLDGDDDGNLYVADTQGAQVLKFDPKGTLALRFGRPGEGLGEFKVIAGIAVDSLGRIYVSDSLGIPVQVFDRTGRALASLGRRGPGPEEFAFPAGVAVDRSGRIWVVDQYRHQVKTFDLAGRFLGSIGTYGLREGELYFPVDVAADDFGRLFILEKGANRLQVFALGRP